AAPLLCAHRFSAVGDGSTQIGTGSGTGRRSKNPMFTMLGTVGRVFYPDMMTTPPNAGDAGVQACSPQSSLLTQIRGDLIPAVARRKSSQPIGWFTFLD